MVAGEVTPNELDIADDTTLADFAEETNIAAFAVGAAPIHAEPCDFLAPTVVGALEIADTDEVLKGKVIVGQLIGIIREIKVGYLEEGKTNG